MGAKGVVYYQHIDPKVRSVYNEDTYSDESSVKNINAPENYPQSNDYVNQIASTNPGIATHTITFDLDNYLFKKAVVNNSNGWRNASMYITRAGVNYLVESYVYSANNLNTSFTDFRDVIINDTITIIIGFSANPGTVTTVNIVGFQY